MPSGWPPGEGAVKTEAKRTPEGFSLDGHENGGSLKEGRRMSAVSYLSVCRIAASMRLFHAPPLPFLENPLPA
jgi:hypothetical protein